jgi:hypothetical protein
MYISNIMKKERFAANTVKGLLYRQKMATMAELKAALNTLVDMTVYRKLKELPYLKSYSDRGKYYTLDDIPAFDQRGLWHHKSVFFSRYGTLVNTLKQFITSSDSGFFESELEQILQVCVRVPLLKLCKEKQITREKLSGRYLYYSATSEVGMRQLHHRREMLEDVILAGVETVGREMLHHELKAAIVLFFSMLDEKQRRLYAGLESLMCGYGGDSKVADLLGLDVHTVAKGRNEIVQRDIDVERTRRTGGGRKAVKKTHRKSSPPSNS